jgi:PAS domain S-box-containing protein
MQAIAELRLKDTAIESSLNAIAMSDLQGKIRYVNAAFCALWGIRREDAIGTSILDLWQDPEAARSAARMLRGDGRWQGVLRARRADGSCADLQVSGSLFFDRAGQPDGALAAFADVTEQVRAPTSSRDATCASTCATPATAWTRGCSSGRSSRSSPPSRPARGAASDSRSCTAS